MRVRLPDERTCAGSTRTRRVRSRACGLALAVGCLAALAVPAGASAAGISAAWRELPGAVDAKAVGRPLPLAGRVTAVAAVPGSPATEIAGTHAGIWRKTGAGRWVDVTNPSWPSTAVNSLAVDPSDPRVIYAGTGYDDIDDDNGQPGAGVLKSTDGGRTWSPLAATRPLMLGYAVTGLAVDPMNPQIVVAAANNGLFRTTDAGTTWTEVEDIPPGDRGMAEVRLAIDQKTGVLLAGVAQAGRIDAQFGTGTISTDHAILKSTDGGASWDAFAVDGGSSTGLVLAPAVASSGGHTYAYALDITRGKEAAFYTSADGGRSWTPKAPIEAKASIAQVVADPQHPTRAYFGIEFGPYEYKWGDSAFQLVGPGPQFGDFRAIAIGPTGRSGRALYSAIDGGSSVYDFHTHRFTDNSDGLIAGIDYSGDARSATFEASGAQDLGVDVFAHGRVREVQDSDAYGVVIDRKHPRTYYASALHGGGSYVVSHDAGAHWSPVKLPGPLSDPTLMRPVQARGAPEVLVLPQRNGPMYVSTDDGRTWSERPSPPPGNPLRSLSAVKVGGAAQPVIYAGTYFGRLWRSRDLGTTWEEVEIPNPTGLAVRDTEVDVPGSAGPGSEHLYVALGIVNPRDYASSPVHGAVLESNDSGSTWNDIGTGLSDTSVNALLLRGGTLVAGTSDGVSQWVGGRWVPAGRGFPHAPVTDIFASADGRAVFATTYGRGTLVAAPPPKPSDAKIRALLHSQLVPRGRAARIEALLRRGGYARTVRALTAGRLTIRWFGPGRALAAIGRRQFSRGGSARLQIHLTARGKRLLRRSRGGVKISAEGSFVPSKRTAVTASRRFVLRH